MTEKHMGHIHFPFFTLRTSNETGNGQAVFQKMADCIKTNMESWSGGQLEIEVIVFANENTELVATSKAHEYIKEA